MASSSAEDTMVGCTMSSSFFFSYTIWALAVTADSKLTDSSRSKYLQQTQDSETQDSQTHRLRTRRLRTLRLKQVQVPAAGSRLTDSSRSKYPQQCTTNAGIGSVENFGIRVVNE